MLLNTRWVVTWHVLSGHQAPKTNDNPPQTTNRYFVVINLAALLMRELFHDSQVDARSYDGLQPRAHFQTWLHAFSVMARSTTGENWHRIAYDLSSDVPGCVPLTNATPESTKLCVRMPCAC